MLLLNLDSLEISLRKSVLSSIIICNFSSLLFAHESNTRACISKATLFHCFHVFYVLCLFYISVTSTFHNSISQIDETGASLASLHVSEETAFLRKKYKKLQHVFWLLTTARQTAKLKFKREMYRKTVCAFSKVNRCYQVLNIQFLSLPSFLSSFLRKV